MGMAIIEKEILLEGDPQKGPGDKGGNKGPGDKGGNKGPGDKGGNKGPGDKGGNKPDKPSKTEDKPQPEPKPEPQPEDKPKPEPQPEDKPKPEPQTEPKRQEPITYPKSESDKSYCQCWVQSNFFSTYFPGNENEKAEEFINWVNDTTEYAGYVRNLNLAHSKNSCDDSMCEYFELPLTREFARAQVVIQGLTKREFLFKIWYKSTQKLEEPAKTDDSKTEVQTQNQTKTETQSIKYSNLSDPSVFFRTASKSDLNRLNKVSFATNLSNLKKLYDYSDLGECKNTADLYLELSNDFIENSFGSPNSASLEDYGKRSKFWYGFLVVLQTIKSNLKKCYSNGKLGNNKKEDSYYNRLNGISPNSYWRIQLDDWDSNGNYSIKDNKEIELAKQNLGENNIIRKKLIEYKEMKTIKESVKQKLLLKLEDKNRKVNKISENLYKIAGDFYSGNYDKFYNKYNKLVESYKNSKMFLMEDSEQSFSNALVKVFKGDEDKFIGEAIPWFINKLGLEGNVASQVESELRRKYGNESDMSGLFSDDWADVVVTAVKDNAKSDISDPSSVMDAVEKVLMTNLDSSDFDYKLKREILKMLRPAQDEKKTKIQDLANQIKKSILDAGSEA
jgi:hypothetical protein